MSDKISALPAVATGALLDASLIPVVQAGQTSQVSVAALRTAIGGAAIYAVEPGETSVVNTAFRRGDVQRYGCVLDGITDDSANFQLALAANKGKRVTIPTGALLHAGILLGDSSYDGTEIVCTGGELKLKPNAATPNFNGSIFGGVIVTGAAQVRLDLKCDGNRANQGIYPNEGVHCLILAGAVDPYCPSLQMREVYGDGVYIDCRDPSTGTGVNSKNVVIDVLRVVNTADAGRNACSVLSCDGLTIGVLDSYKVGGIINSNQMPGGLDLEPNWPAQRINDVVVGALNVTTAGSSGLGVVGQAITNDATRDWNIQRVHVGKANINSTSQGRPIIRRCHDVTADIINTMTGTRNAGYFLDYAEKLRLKISTRGTTRGGFIGFSDYVYDSDIEIDARDYSTSGVDVIGVGRSRIRGKAYGASTAGAFGVHTFSNSRAITQTGVVYEVDAPNDTVGVRAFYNEPADLITFGVGTCARNCDWSGYANEASMVTGLIPRFNIQEQPSASGFRRLAGSGTAHVAGDYALAGWGTTPSVSAVTARDTGGRVSVTCGTTPSANPTVTLTFKDGTWSTTPAIASGRGDVAAPTTGEWRLTSISATQAIFTFLGTPVAATVYILDFLVIGK